jgi:ATP-dependent RNA helicase RhlE
VKYFVLDEADMMLDMGMIVDVRKIITYLPPVRQNMMFSATMPTEIAKLADTILKNPTRVEVTPAGKTIDIVTQSIYFIDKVNKVNLLIELLKNTDIESALVFSRTKHGADKIVKSLERAGLTAQAIHGNKSQNARQFALSNFKERKTRILVATDIAARGIDIDQLSHVFNYDLPEVAETYVHRIGRTGRAGLGGTAISFCSHEEKPYFKSIEKLIGKSIEEVRGHNYPITQFFEVVKEEKFVRTPRPPRTDNAKKPFVGKSFTAKKEQSYNHARKAGQRSKSN